MPIHAIYYLVLTELIILASGFSISFLGGVSWGLGLWGSAPLTRVLFRYCVAFMNLHGMAARTLIWIDVLMYISISISTNIAGRGGGRHNRWIWMHWWPQAVNVRVTLNIKPGQSR